MSRSIIVMALLVSGAAFAQGKGGSGGLGRHGPAQLVPLGPAVPSGSATARTPMLRSWVTGWALTGSKPDAYEVRCDEVTQDCGAPILRTRAGAEEPLGTGSLTHSEPANLWRGRRVKLSAELRAGRIGGWAGLWMRVDGPGGKPLAFDNMQNRALKGTSSYETYSVVLDVPLEAEQLSFGVLLHGPGAVFIRGVDFDEVGEEEASTDLLGPLLGRGRVARTGIR